MSASPPASNAAGASTLGGDIINSNEFTEEARRNKIQGVVRMKILIDSTGKVAQAVVTRGLPDGLDTEAIRAAYQMRFRPAMKNGSPVSFWLSNVEVEFNLR